MISFDIKSIDISEDIVDGYLLIDPLNIDPELFDATLPMQRCTPPALASADAMTPRLIALAALSPQQQASARRMVADESADLAPPVLCAWLRSDLHIDALARHIGRFLVAPGADGHQVLWRYSDPRVFSLALQVLSSEQLRVLLGPVSVWRFPWCGRWWSVDGPGPGTDPLGSSAAAWPTPAQWQRLAHSALITRVLRERQDEQAPFSDAMCLAYQRDISQSLFHGQHVLHLSDDDDLTQYALACARYGDGFSRHPALADAWAALARGESTWTALRAMLSDAQYLALKTTTARVP